MTRILFKVDVRRRASLYEALAEQHAQRTAFGEKSFSLHVDDNARHIGYVMLEWESLSSAHRFLESQESHTLVKAWPIEEVLAATVLQDINETLARIKRDGDA